MYVIMHVYVRTCSPPHVSYKQHFGELFRLSDTYSADLGKGLRFQHKLPPKGEASHQVIRRRHEALWTKYLSNILGARGASFRKTQDTKQTIA